MHHDDWESLEESDSQKSKFLQGMEIKEMKKKLAVQPRGYRTCTASLAVSDVPAALAFYANAFGADTRASDSKADPRFASIKIGNSMLFVTAGWSANLHVPTSSAAAVNVAHHVYVENVDAAFDKAVAAGAVPIAAAADTFWGERCATVQDPFGHVWTLATRLEQLSSGDIEERRSAWFEGPALLTEAVSSDSVETEVEQSDSAEVGQVEPATA